MKLLVQWATRTPRKWVEIDSREWALLPKKPVPIGGEVIDDEPGWVHDLCVQGMCFMGADHIAVEHLGDSVRVTSWRDDPEDYEPGKFHARVLTFHPLKPDAAHGGAINTDIESVIYVGREDWAYFKSLDLADSEIRSWDEFVRPPEEITRHGIWLTDEIAEAHRESVEPPSWREWGEDGTVPEQRRLGRYPKPDGTITYYMRGTLGGGGPPGDDEDSDCIPGAYGYKLITGAPSIPYIVKDTIPAGVVNRICFSWTTESDAPPAPWPTGTYDASVDVNSIGGDCVGRTRIIRTKVDCSITETFGTSTDYSTTGIKYFGLTGFDPIGNAGRYQIRTIADNNSPHSQQVLWLSVRDTDAYGSGPWTAATQVSSARSARTAGKVTDAGSTRAARTAGKVTDAGSTRAARTAGRVTGAGSTRAARTEGKITGTEISSSRDAATYGIGTETPRYVDCTVNSSSSPRTNPTFSHTVPAGDNRFLVVAVYFLEAESVSGITYNGVALTGFEQYAYYGIGIECYGIALGSSASPTVADVVVTSSTGEWNPDCVVAANFTDVDQSDPTGAEGHAVHIGTYRTATITPELADSLLFGFAIFGGDDAYPVWGDNPAVDTRQKDRWKGNTGGGNNDLEDISYLGSELPATSVGEYNFKVVCSVSAELVLTVVELKKVFHADSERAARTAGKVTDAGSTRAARTEGKVSGTQVASSRAARTAGKVTDAGDTRAARTAGKVTDAGDTRAARTAGKVTGVGDTRAARTVGQATVGSNRGARTEGQATVGSNRSARTAGKVTDASSTRAARTLGGITTSSTRAARTEGKITGTQTSDSRKARTAGKETDFGDSRDARTAGKVADFGDSRDARTAGKVAGFGDSRDARTAGKVADFGDSRDARTAGKVADFGDSRDARTAGKVADFGDSRDARTAGKVTGASSSRGARTEGIITGLAAQGAMNKLPTGNITHYGEI